MNFVTPELAIELREIGFNEPCLKLGNSNFHAFWKFIEVDDEDLTVDVKDILQREYTHPDLYGVPTYEQAFDFFRKNKIRFNIIFDPDEEYYFEIWYWKVESNWWQCYHESAYLKLSYEEIEKLTLEKIIECYKANLWKK